MQDLRGFNQASSHRTSFSSSLSDSDHLFRKVEPAYSFVGMHCIFDTCKSSVMVLKFGRMSSDLLAYGASDGTLIVCSISQPPSIIKELRGHSKDVTVVDFCLVTFFLLQFIYILLQDDTKRADASTDWKEVTSPDGRRYYYNKVARQSKWSLPDEMKRGYSALATREILVFLKPVFVTVSPEETSPILSSAISAVSSPVPVVHVAAVVDPLQVVTSGEPSIPIVPSSASGNDTGAKSPVVTVCPSPAAENAGVTAALVYTTATSSFDATQGLKDPGSFQHPRFQKKLYDGGFGPASLVWRSLYHGKPSGDEFSGYVLLPYKSWVSERGNTPKISSNDSDGMPAYVSSAYRKAMELYKACAQHEEQISSANHYSICCGLPKKL
ncbi:hypothetical protein IFM89_013026 [Coptis chinensis]|uniref:WW domain-containing protein n=1 Tax=Coptis chinensis TaxID=261450 RepID=A0A835LDK2_9MAGN|nr:hypothetical protein IFM89_013026 [Coptis chinensis]